MRVNTDMKRTESANLDYVSGLLDRSFDIEYAWYLSLRRNRILVSTCPWPRSQNSLSSDKR